MLQVRCARDSWARADFCIRGRLTEPLLARHNATAWGVLPVVCWLARTSANGPHHDGYRIAMAERHSTTQAADGLLPIDQRIIDFRRRRRSCCREIGLLAGHPARGSTAYS